jgi:hypothetical protein
LALTARLLCFLSAPETILHARLAGTPPRACAHCAHCALDVTLRRGGGYANEALIPIIERIENAEHVNFDRWKLLVQTENEEKVFIMNNYMSLGADAAVALRFHLARQANPRKFSSRAKNKLKYGTFTSKQLVSTKFRMQTRISIEVDGVEVAIPSSAQGLIITNLPSYSAGADLWGAEKNDGYSVQRMDDRKLEVVCITGLMHMVRFSFFVFRFSFFGFRLILTCALRRASSAKSPRQSVWRKEQKS